MSKISTAAVLVIGDEILSGRTKDSNVGYIADCMTSAGIDLCEARVVADRAEAIVEAINALRTRYSWVFSTGGIGPTHDDITADAMAEAFGVDIGHHPEAVVLLENYFRANGREPNEARMRMARIPHGATLVPNAVSVAPGFQIGNVFVMAGVPRVMHAMMEEILPRLGHGIPVQSCTVTLYAGEGEVAAPLGAIQKLNPAVSIGSYPFEDKTGFATRLVMRSRDVAALATTFAQVRACCETLVQSGKARGFDL